MASETKKGSTVWETVKTVFWALVIAGLFRTLFFQPFWIPSGSMKDTLLIGDFLFVNKMAYGYSYASCPSIRLGPIDIDAKDICGWLGDDSRILGGTPEQGDIIVFRHPVDGTDFIKRLIGLPGDRVQMRGGVLHINGEPVEIEAAGEFVEEFAPQGPMGIRPRCANGVVGLGADCIKERSSRRCRTAGAMPSSISARSARTIPVSSRCPRGIISSWATIATIPPTRAFRRPWEVSASCPTRT